MTVTGVQMCALPISRRPRSAAHPATRQPPNPAPPARVAGPGSGGAGLGGWPVAGCAALRGRRAGATPQVRGRCGAGGVGLGPRAQGYRGIRRSGDRDQAAARSLRRARARVGERMSVTHDEVRRIARIAELDVSDDALPLPAEQMSRVLEDVAQINAVPASEAVKPFVPGPDAVRFRPRSEEHTSELQSQSNLVCRLLLEKKKT